MAPRKCGPFQKTYSLINVSQVISGTIILTQPLCISLPSSFYVTHKAPSCTEESKREQGGTWDLGRGYEQTYVAIGCQVFHVLGKKSTIFLSGLV